MREVHEPRLQWRHGEAWPSSCGDSLQEPIALVGKANPLTIWREEWIRQNRVFAHQGLRVQGIQSADHDCFMLAASRAVGDLRAMKR
jgi:hypothetical protein